MPKANRKFSNSTRLFLAALIFSLTSIPSSQAKRIAKRLLKGAAPTSSAPLSSSKLKVIALKQRPRFIMHGVISSCSLPRYKNSPLIALGFECLETGKYGDSLASYKEQAQRGCNELNRRAKAAPAAFANGVYLVAFSAGGVVARYMQMLCKRAGLMIKRVVTVGTPNLGVVSIPLPRLSSMLDHLVTITNTLPTYVAKAVGDVWKPDPSSAFNNAITSAVGEGKIHQQFAAHLQKTNFASNKRLELFVAILNDEDDSLDPLGSAVFLAPFDEAKKTLGPFTQSPLYPTNYLGLKDMFDEGRFTTCLASGLHANLAVEAERAHVVQLLSDDCVFNAARFARFTDAELYVKCLRLKMLRRKETTAMKCDLNRQTMRDNPNFMKPIKGVEFEPKEFQVPKAQLRKMRVKKRR